MQSSVTLLRLFNPRWKRSIALRSERSHPGTCQALAFICADPSLNQPHQGGSTVVHAVNWRRSQRFKKHLPPMYYMRQLHPMLQDCEHLAIEIEVEFADRRWAHVEAIAPLVADRRAMIMKRMVDRQAEKDRYCCRLDPGLGIRLKISLHETWNWNIAMPGNLSGLFWFLRVMRMGMVMEWEINSMELTIISSRFGV